MTEELKKFDTIKMEMSNRIKQLESDLWIKNSKS